MNDLIRPALYDAKHRISPSEKKTSFVNKLHEFVGPICETSDKFLLTKKYQKIKQGDVLIIHDVGAYGMVLSSNYNMRPKPAEVLINGSKNIIIKKRQRINVTWHVSGNLLWLNGGLATPHRPRANEWGGTACCRQSSSDRGDRSCQH